MFYKFEMQHIILAMLAVMASIANAISVSNGIIRIDGKKHVFGQKSIPLDIMDRNVDISFDLQNDDSEKYGIPGPEQVSVILADKKEDGTQMYFYPEYSQENGNYELTVSLSNDISPYFKKQTKVYVKVLVGDPDHTKNLLKIVAVLEPSSKLIEDTQFKAADRFGPKPEIHHIFQQDAKQAPAFVSQFFIVDVVIVLLGFFGLLIVGKSVNFQNLSEVGPSALLLLVSLAAFEFIFCFYYLGDSIFTTLSRAAIVSLFTFFFGSRTLQSLYLLRTSGKR